MKKHILYIILPLLMVACSSEPDEGSLYKRYAAQPELAVAQVCDFVLNDTVRIDVVLLQAMSDEAWADMRAEFGIEDTVGVSSWLANPERPAQRMEWTGEPRVRVIASAGKKAVGLYKLENEHQYDALIDYQLDHIKN